METLPYVSQWSCWLSQSLTSIWGSVLVSCEMLIYHVKIATCMLVDSLVIKLYGPMIVSLPLHTICPSVIGNAILQHRHIVFCCTFLYTPGINFAIHEEGSITPNLLGPISV